MTELPGRDTLSATESTMDPARPGKGPLGALAPLSSAARRALILSAILSFCNAVLLVGQAFLLADVLSAVVRGTMGDRTAQLAVLLALVAGRALTGWAVRIVSVRAAARAKEELRAKALDHALKLGPEWIARRGHGELTSLTTKGLDALDAYFTQYLPALVTAAIVPLAAGAAILVADWPSAALVVITVPLVPLFAILIGKHTAERVAEAADAEQRLSGHLLELVRALPILSAFRRAEAQAETVRKISERHRRATLKTLKVAFASAFALELIATLSVALVAVVIGVRLVSGDLPLAIGLGVLILVPECYQPLRAVGAAFHASEDGVEAVRRVADVLAEPLPPNGSGTPAKGEIHVGGLRVSRRGGFAPDGETFSVRPGEITWLRAPSGGGKSTTLAVLLGFAQAHDGSITVGGTDLADADLDRWRENVAWVPQSPVFGGGTVRDEVGDDDILGELGLAGLAQRPVSKLSQGQRQRVAVARALVRVRSGAWLLLLDEPTAHLDEVNAALVMAAVRKAVDNGAAAIIAAHERTTGVDMSADAVREVVTTEERTATRPVPWRHLLQPRFFGGALLGAAALLAGVALTALSGWLIAKASQQPPILTLTVMIVGVRTFGLGRAGLRYLERLVTHDAAFRIAGSLRVRLWESLVRLGPARALRAGEEQRRLVGDTDTVRDLLPRVVTPLVVVALVAAGAVAVQAAVLPEAGLALAAAVLVSAFAPLLALRAERRATSALAAGRRSVSAQVLSLFEAAAELIAYGADKERRRRIATTDAALTAEARRQAFGAGAADALIILATGAATVVSTGFAVSAVAAGALDPVLAPVVALVPLALAEVLSLLPPAAQHWDTLRQARLRLAACHEGSPWDEIRPMGTPHDTGRVRIRNADLGWPGTDQPVLTGVDLDIAPGTHVAVIGPSGAGKSTLVAALLGFLKPSKGDVAVSENVAWAPQEPMLVSTTVAENLRLAKPTASEADLRKALYQAVLEDVELTTMLDSAGAGLSGGQAQRVALARAVLGAARADLVLLDEPTAHLDEPTARTVRERLGEALAGKTVVHVTHNAAEAADADVVLEVREGRVTTRVLAGAD
ncbi:glutathione/cysteine ABC transporter permease/ATP-binding protein [Amycolatopsis thailandensis]|uniref:Glutathione/cysteine ABC transporter permease/ATP-binding protein n=1 Tax=Amycolatopsis thailandensis TaxID=589330 RepID=A0A229RY66_9PSEU|nr:thiol reductant ABC exporter subunit CydD [Amycolatopsis thailandensis]OXM51613.1 glutathione/cysteine ABC transporter permease/ATP-binding protein [Amycolatopsis thailandensis]